MGNLEREDQGFVFEVMETGGTEDTREWSVRSCVSIPLGYAAYETPARSTVVCPAHRAGHGERRGWVDIWDMVVVGMRGAARKCTGKSSELTAKEVSIGEKPTKEDRGRREKPRRVVVWKTRRGLLLHGGGWKSSRGL